jgi:hypothetical protein
MRVIRYPQFLGTIPSFFGVSILEIGFIVVAVNLTGLLGIHIIWGAAFTGFGLLLSRLVRHYVDLIGLRRSYPRIKTYAWLEEFQRLNRGMR